MYGTKTEVQLFIGSMECKVPREELMTVDDVDFPKNQLFA